MNKTTDILKRFVELAPPEWGFGNDRGIAIWLYPSEEEDPMEILLSNDYASAEAIIFLWDWLDRALGPCTVFRQGGPAFPPPKFSFDGGCNWGETRIEALVKTCVQHLEEAKVAA